MYHCDLADDDYKLIDPDMADKAKPCEVDVKCTASKEYAKFVESRIQNVQKRAQEDEESDEFSLEEAIDNDVKKISVLVKGIRGFTRVDGTTPLDASNKADVEFFLRIHEGFRRQIEAFAKDEEAFFTPSSTATA